MQASDVRDWVPHVVQGRGAGCERIYEIGRTYLSGISGRGTGQAELCGCGLHTWLGVGARG